ncbi:MAG: helix-turn-helix domain-containing protein [Clostridiales bacterium]|nr:helix-turn-helix domain-containing protein [Clostridiales bacterium]
MNKNNSWHHSRKGLPPEHTVSQTGNRIIPPDPPQSIDEIHSIFSRRLRHIMYQRHVRAVDLAKMIYVSRPTISGYCNGRRLPDLERLRLICICLDVSADYLLGLKESPNVLSF